MMMYSEHEVPAASQLPDQCLNYGLQSANRMTVLSLIT